MTTTPISCPLNILFSKQLREPSLASSFTGNIRKGLSLYWPEWNGEVSICVFISSFYSSEPTVAG
jgi:hypothetical protein